MQTIARIYSPVKNFDIAIIKNKIEISILDKFDLFFIFNTPNSKYFIMFQNQDLICIGYQTASDLIIT